AAPPGDSGGPRPGTGDGRAGAPTLPAGKASRRTTGEMGPVAGDFPGAALPPARRYSCITVGGAASSSTGLRRGRLVPQVKQIRSSWLTAAPQPGQVSVAKASSRT